MSPGDMKRLAPALRNLAAVFVDIADIFATLAEAPEVAAPAVVTMVAAPVSIPEPQQPRAEPAPSPPRETIRASAPAAVRVGKLWSRERDALIASGWPAGVPVRMLLPRINALPGKAVTASQIGVRAAYINVKRPPGFEQMHATGRTPWIPAAEAAGACVPDAAPAQVPVPVAAAPAGVLFVPAARPVVAKPAPVRKPDADAVAAFIAKNGVTKCPAAALEPTTAVLPAADRAVVRAHTDALNQARDEHAKRTRGVIARRTQAAKARLAKEARA